MTTLTAFDATYTDQLGGKHEAAFATEAEAKAYAKGLRELDYSESDILAFAESIRDMQVIHGTG